MAAPPAGTLVFSGLGQFPLKFYDPDGTQRTPPTSDPEAGDGVRGVIFLQNGKLATLGGFPAVPTIPAQSTGTAIFAADFDSAVQCAVTAGRGAARDDAGRFYGSSGSTIRRYDDTGASLASWTVASTVNNLAVNGAGTIAYYTLVTSTTVVRAWDLVGNTDLGTFHTLGVGESFVSSFCNLICIGDEVFIGTDMSSGSGEVRRYNSSGVLQGSPYALAGTNAAVVVLTEGQTPDTFWVCYYNSAVSTWSGVTVSEIDIATGTVLNTFEPEDGEFNYDFSFCVLPGDAAPPVNLITDMAVIGTTKFNNDGKAFAWDDDGNILATLVPPGA